MAWRLVAPSRVDHYRFAGGLYANRVVTLSVLGTNVLLSAVESPDGNAIADAVYYWQGGREHVTEDSAIRDLWLVNGFEVQDV